MAAWLIPQLILAQAAKPGPAKKQGPAHAPSMARQATGPAAACCTGANVKAAIPVPITAVNTFLLMVGAIFSIVFL